MENINKYTSITGTVTRVNTYGCFVRDDITDTTVFYFGNGNIGDRVYLTVCKVDTVHHRITCNLDSVLEYAA